MLTKFRVKALGVSFASASSLDRLVKVTGGMFPIQVVWVEFSSHFYNIFIPCHSTHQFSVSFSWRVESLQIAFCFIYYKILKCIIFITEFFSYVVRCMFVWESLSSHTFLFQVHVHESIQGHPKTLVKPKKVFECYCALDFFFPISNTWKNWKEEDFIMIQLRLRIRHWFEIQKNVL